MASRIEDYGLIGDCETAALVAKDSSIDWLCWPRFDSAACFAALLGTPENGRWKLAPADTSAQSSRQYCQDTLILETQFQTAQGSVAIIDFMPPRQKQSDLVRVVRGLRGQVDMDMELSLRFDYGKSIPWVTRMDDGALRAIAGPNMVILRTSAPIHGENLKTVSQFTIKEGETVCFVLTYSPSNLELPDAVDPEAALKETETFWREWTAQCIYKGPWADAVQRSLITLKAMTYAPTGGILAAASASLPEKLGGQRNWDYRFCWLRDASLTLRALMHGGYFDEATDWQNWLLRGIAGSPEQAQIMYGVAGERELPELELDWLPGYEGSRPVRIGNAASKQLQLDLYAEICGMLHYAREGQLPRNEPALALEQELLENLEKTWHEPDHGMWEVRGPGRQFTHSKIMAWLAFDRAILSREKFGLKGPLERWRTVRQEIHDEVCCCGFNSDLGSFVQSYGSTNLDTSLLMIAKSGFLPPSDARVVGTVRAIEKHLLRDGVVMRYNTTETNDGLPPGEGVFLACSFWLADNYALLGRCPEATDLFENLLKI